RGVINFKPYEVTGTTQFIELITELQELIEDGHTPIDLVDHLLEEGKYKEYILGEDEDEDSSRMENIETLKYVLNNYTDVNEFLDYIETMTSMAKHSIDGVQ